MVSPAALGQCLRDQQSGGNGFGGDVKRMKCANEHGIFASKLFGAHGNRVDGIVVSTQCHDEILYVFLARK
jgi:hypothetical protein